MTRLTRLLVGLVRIPLMWWVRAHTAQRDPAASLNLDASRPVCYILPFPSIADQAVLERLCADNGLPVPKAAGKRRPRAGRAISVALPPFKSRRAERYRELIARLIEQEGGSDSAMQIVPVSVFWGRNPGKETSLFKIMFSDNLGAGMLRRIFIVLVNGRNAMLSFGQPLDIDQLLGNRAGGELATQKLVRVLRVHFRRQRAATLGPTLSLRGRMVSAVLAQPMVQETIRAEAEQEHLPAEQVQDRAREYAEEIAADYSNAVISFAVRVLTWLFNRVYQHLEVFHVDRMRQVARDYSIIYVPAHRSHLDYLLISYVLHANGLVPPHIAAGINLNMPLLGSLLRKMGAFYIRRSFDGNRLYTAVFRSYCDVLVQRGYSIQFFPEGGRSRTGRLLPPKTGMLGMLTQTCIRNPGKPVALVPVYVGYDKVMEVASYFGELQGSSKKRKESLLGVVRALRILRMNLGRAYISFGEPLAVHDWLDRHDPNWRDLARSEQRDQRPDWLRPAVQEMAQQIMVGLNRAAVLNPVGMVTTMLLAAPQHAIPEDELFEQIEGLQELLALAPYHRDTTVLNGTGPEMLAETETVLALTRTDHEWGDIISIEGKAAVMATYCRNSVLHMVAIPGLVASYFLNRESMKRDALLAASSGLYAFLKTELFLSWNEDDARAAVADMVDAMCRQGYLRDDGDGVLWRPALSEIKLAALIGLGYVLRDTLERYCLSSVLLAETPEGRIGRDAFERRCQLLAGRLALLNGRRAPEFFDRRLFAGFLDTLKSRGMVTETGTGDEAMLEIAPELKQRADRFMAFMDVDIQQRVRRLIALPVVS